jgi:hypothetical protein
MSLVTPIPAFTVEQSHSVLANVSRFGLGERHEKKK